MSWTDPPGAAGLDDGTDSAPVWTVFGDLMAGVLGAFVLLLVGTLFVQAQLASSLQDEVRKREQAEAQRASLEQALAGPLAAGRITLTDGRIGISGRLLFDVNSDRLQPEGRELLRSLVGPLQGYLQGRDLILMVSGFTDDRQVSSRNRDFEDNWELSAQRALTVTRALMAEGMPAQRVFAAAFGAQQPLASNRTEAGRAQNRRVEMAPVPRKAAPDPERGSGQP